MDYVAVAVRMWTGRRDGQGTQGVKDRGTDRGTKTFGSNCWQRFLMAALSLFHSGASPAL